MKKAGKGRLSELDIIFSIVLGIFCIYLFFLVGESPAPTATELGAAFWPRIILVLLILLIIVNIVNSLKKLKGSNEKLTAGFNLGEFLKSKLFVGMILVAVMAILMPIGFIPVSFLFLIAYGVLLGERRIGFLIIVSLVITAILYILFQGALDIMLARGTGIFRDFALFFETKMPF
jgi:hypothetical protein